MNQGVASIYFFFFKESPNYVPKILSGPLHARINNAKTVWSSLQSSEGIHFKETI